MTFRPRKHLGSSHRACNGRLPQSMWLILVNKINLYDNCGFRNADNFTRKFQNTYTKLMDRQPGFEELFRALVSFLGLGFIRVVPREAGRRRVLYMDLALFYLRQTFSSSSAHVMTRSRDSPAPLPTFLHFLRPDFPRTPLYLVSFSPLSHSRALLHFPGLRNLLSCIPDSTRTFAVLHSTLQIQHITSSTIKETAHQTNSISVIRLNLTTLTGSTPEHS